VCVESRRATLAPFPSGSNDLLEPIRDGVITADHVHADPNPAESNAEAVELCDLRGCR
jgi:hypothetical protein